MWTLATHLPPTDTAPAAADGGRTPLYAWPFALSGANAPPPTVTSLTLLAPGYRSAALALGPVEAGVPTAVVAPSPASPSAAPATPTAPAPAPALPAVPIGPAPVGR